MKNRIIALCFFILGISLFYLSKEKTNLDIENNSQIKFSFYQNLDYFKNYKFLVIFTRNIIVGLLLSILGYFTGGFFTIIILIWNGFLVAMVYNLAIYRLPLDVIIYSSKHAPIEIYAFLLFSQFGLDGRFFINKILRKNEIDFSLIPKFKNLIFPTALLFIASILEIL